MNGSATESKASIHCRSAAWISECLLAWQTVLAETSLDTSPVSLHGRIPIHTNQLAPGHVDGADELWRAVISDCLALLGQGYMGSLNRRPIDGFVLLPQSSTVGVSSADATGVLTYQNAVRCTLDCISLSFHATVLQGSSAARRHFQLGMSVAAAPKKIMVSHSGFSKDSSSVVQLVLRSTCLESRTVGAAAEPD